MSIKHWLKKLLFGECPKCHSVNIRYVEGWKKIECQDCKYIWNY